MGEAAGGGGRDRRGTDAVLGRANFFREQAGITSPQGGLEGTDFREGSGGQLFQGLTSSPTPRQEGAQATRQQSEPQAAVSTAPSRRAQDAPQDQGEGRRQTVLGGVAQASGRRRQRSASVLTLGLASNARKKLLGQ